MSIASEADWAVARAYDEEAVAAGWWGPQIAFGLVYEFLRPGQSVVDLGIGTGLAAELFRRAELRVSGLDADPQMLGACRAKGFTDLSLHDLTVTPYPYADESVDHVVCAGVLNFLPELAPVFAEVARMLRPGGVFVFTVGDRTGDAPAEIVLGPEYTQADESVTVYFEDVRQIEEATAATGLTVLRDVAFLVPMDRERSRTMLVRAYVARRGANGDHEGVTDDRR